MHTCNFEGVKLGVMICYDREYPESTKVLLLKGAELIIVPYGCCSMKPRVQVISARKFENRIGIVMANPNGKNAGFWKGEYYGDHKENVYLQQRAVYD